jgi:hypothetical protein
MKLRHRVAAIVLSASMFVGLETRPASAQDTPPDLRMLMNLDLFESRPGNPQGAPAPGGTESDGSMLDQIRTLNAMGYLGNHRDTGGNDAPPAAVGASEPSANPTFDAEGPQR